MNALRRRVIQAMHVLEATYSDPSVEQYADAALSALGAESPCTCSTASPDRMPLIDAQCPIHSPTAIQEGI